MSSIYKCQQKNIKSNKLNAFIILCLYIIFLIRSKCQKQHFAYNMHLWKDINRIVLLSIILLWLKIGFLCNRNFFLGFQKPIEKSHKSESNSYKFESSERDKFKQIFILHKIARFGGFSIKIYIFHFI